MSPTLQVIPATPGYYCLNYCIDDEPGGTGEYEVSKYPVIGWKIDQSEPDETWPIPITLDPSNGGGYVLCPDGSVEAFGSAYSSVDAWIADVKRIAEGQKRFEAARLARLKAGGAK